MASQTFVWYNESSDYNWLPGHWLSELDPPGEGSMYYQDSFGVHVAGDFSPQAPAQPLPEYIGSCPPNEFALLITFGIIDWIKNLCKPKKKPAPKPKPIPVDEGSNVGGILFEPLDLSEITSEAPLPWLKRLTRGFICDVRKPVFGIGRQYWCNACQIKCAEWCGPNDVFENLGCILACNARYIKCLATGNF